MRRASSRAIARPSPKPGVRSPARAAREAPEDALALARREARRRRRRRASDGAVAVAATVVVTRTAPPP